MNDGAYAYAGMCAIGFFIDFIFSFD